jgi:uridine kinase
MKKNKKTIINFFGGSGSGKSFLIKSLSKNLRNVSITVVPADAYLKTNKYDDFLEYLKSNHYEWDLLLRHLSKDIGEEFTIPFFDFNKFKRLDKNDGIILKINKIIIIDSVIPFPYADYYIYIKTSSEIRKKRILHRNKKGNVDYWRDYIMKNWEKLEKINNAKLTDNISVDLVINGDMSESYNIDKIEKLLIEKNLLDRNKFKKLSKLDNTKV